MILCKRLGLSYLDSLKLLASYYFSRLGISWPLFFLVHLSHAGKVLRIPLRPNGADYKVLADVFLNHFYKIEASGVQTIIDLGANIGLSTLYLKTLYPDARVACVEPVPANVEVLKQTLLLNGIDDAHVFSGAIGTDNGSALLMIHSDPTAHSLIPNLSIGPLPSIEVPQISVKSLMEQLGFTMIDLLKIDIEGYEKTLFMSKTDWLDSTRYIVGEAHAHVSYGLLELQRDLSRYGFSVQQEYQDSVYGMIIFTARRRDVEVAPAF